MNTRAQRLTIVAVRYVAGYTQHAPIAFWTLVFALLVTLGTAVFAGARHAWIAMMLRPAIALRT